MPLPPTAKAVGICGVNVMEKRKLKKSYIVCIVALLIVVLLVPQIVYAAYVGDTVGFTASNVEEQSQGSSNSSTRTEQEKYWDNANYSNNREITQISTEQLEHIDKNSVMFYVKDPDRIVLTTSDRTPITVLEEITSKKNDYYPDGYSYRISNRYTGDKGIALNNEQYGVLKDELADKGYGTIHSSFEIDSIIWEMLDKMTEDEVTAFIEKLKYTGGEVIRENITGQADIIDFENYTKRYEALEEYLAYYAGEDSVNTQLIVEIKVESTANSVLWTSVPQTWYATGQTHFWQFECVESYDGAYHAPMQMFANSSVSQTFYYPGKYHVSATQLLQQTYYDALSYSINEYWVIAETGQVIWKNESTGSTIPTNNQKPVSDLRLSNVVNYKQTDLGTYYVSVYDAEIEVITNSWNGTFAAPTIWDADFTTYRIQ